MFCGFCGKEISKEDTQCPYCKKEVNNQQKQQASLFRADTKENYNFFISKKVLKVVVLGLVCFVTVLISITTLVSYFNRPDLTKCIELDTTGYNGYAYSSYKINMQTLKEEISKGQDKKSSYYAEFDQLDWIKMQIEESILKSGKWEHLCNGDESILEINDLRSLSKSVGIKFRNKTKISHSVSNLQEPQIMDFHDVFSPVFYGSDGNGSVQFVIDSNKVPFDIYEENNILYIDNIPIELKTSGNEGTLSNNETITLSFPDSSQAFSDIINKYGCGFDVEKVDYTVSGLGDLPQIDVFANLDIVFHGVNGDAEMDVQWKEDKILFDHYKIVKDDEDDDYHGYFSIYCNIDLDKTLSFSNRNHIGNGDGFNYHVGDYVIYGNHMSDLTGGQIIDLGILAEDGSKISEDYLQFGFKFEPCTKQATVDGNSLSQYITSVEQLSPELVSEFATRNIQSIQDHLMWQWSWLVHKEDEYIGSDQKILSCTLSPTAYFVKSIVQDDFPVDTLYMVYTCVVRDSGLLEDKTIYILAGTDNLMTTLLLNPKKQLIDDTYLNIYEASSSATDIMGYISMINKSPDTKIYEVTLD